MIRLLGLRKRYDDDEDGGAVFRPLFGNRLFLRTVAAVVIVVMVGSLRASKYSTLVWCKDDEDEEDDDDADKEDDKSVDKVAAIEVVKFDDGNDLILQLLLRSSSCTAIDFGLLLFIFKM